MEGVWGSGLCCSVCCAVLCLLALFCPTRGSLGLTADLPLASAGSDTIGCSRVLLGHTWDAARSY